MYSMYMTENPNQPPLTFFLSSHCFALYFCSSLYLMFKVESCFPFDGIAWMFLEDSYIWKVFKGSFKSSSIQFKLHMILFNFLSEFKAVSNVMSRFFVLSQKCYAVSNSHLTMKGQTLKNHALIFIRFRFSCCHRDRDWWYIKTWMEKTSIDHQIVIEFLVGCM